MSKAQVARSSGHNKESNWLLFYSSLKKFSQKLGRTVSVLDESWVGPQGQRAGVGDTLGVISETNSICKMSNLSQLLKSSNEVHFFYLPAPGYLKGPSKHGFFTYGKFHGRHWFCASLQYEDLKKTQKPLIPTFYIMQDSALQHLQQHIFPFTRVLAVSQDALFLI